VRFTQDSISGKFRNGGDLNDVIADLSGPRGADVAARFEPIRLVEHNGQLFTLDNRRLAAFSREIPTKVKSPRRTVGEVSGI
jgi:hypothetical protein